MTNVLFVCVQNAGRSQMAEALFARAADAEHAARSAGSRPAARVHEPAVAALAEVGIDVADRVPRALARDDVEWADVVVTMGCGDECPYVPGKTYRDWDLPDPAGKGVEETRVLRDEIDRRALALVGELAAA